MKNMICFLLILCSFQTTSQTTISGMLLDASTKEAIPYVNIGILNATIGTVSDHRGTFELNSQSDTDSLFISSIGYETRKISVHSVIANKEIYLTPVEYELADIEISGSSFDKEVILGERNTKKRGNSFGFGNAQLGAELGALIPIDKETYIKSMNFTLNHAKGDSLLLRINIYDYKDKTLGEKIVKHNIFIKDKQKKGLYTIDLSAYDIILSNDVLLTLEWLRDFDEMGNESITFDTKKSRKLKGTYIRYSSSSSFSRMPYDDNHKPCFYFVGKQSSK